MPEQITRDFTNEATGQKENFTLVNGEWVATKSLTSQLVQAQPDPVRTAVESKPLTFERKGDTNPIRNTLRTIGNIPGSAIKETGNIISGLAQAPGAIWDVGKYLADTSQGTLGQRALNVGGALVKGVVEPYSTVEKATDTIVENPVKPLLDIAAILSLRGLGNKGTLDALKSLKTGGIEKLRSGVISHYAKGFKNEKINIPDLNVAPVRDIDAVNMYKNIAGEEMSVGQASGNPKALFSESSNPTGVSEKLDRFNQASIPWYQKLYNEETGGTTGINLGDNPSDVAGVLFKKVNDAIAERQLALDASEMAVKQEQASLGKDIYRALPKTGAVRKIDGQTISINEVAQNPSKFITKLAPKNAAERIATDELKARYDQWESQKTAWETGKRELNATMQEPNVKMAMRGRDYLGELEGRTAKPDTLKDPNADITKMVKAAIASPQKVAQTLIALPGVEKQEVAAVLMNELYRGSVTNEVFNPVKFADGLTKLARGLSAGDAITSQTRTSLLSFARTLAKANAHSTAGPNALSWAKQGENAGVTLTGAATPVLIGGNLMQGRAGYAGTRLIELHLRSGVLSRLLLNPEGAVLMSRLSGMSQTAPQFSYNIKQLIKVMGQLNLTGQLKNGKNVTTVGATGSPQ